VRASALISNLTSNSQEEISMYVEKILNKIANHLNKSIDEILEIYGYQIIFIPDDNDPNIGLVVKESRHLPHVKIYDIIAIRDSEFIEINGHQVGISTSLLNIRKIVQTKPKNIKSKRELSSMNVLTAVKIVTEIMEADADMAMDQLMAINEKVKVAAKLKELGFETKEQRKNVHDAIRYHKSRIKQLGTNGAAEDTAEKYKFEPAFIKTMVGFQNKLKQNRFK
jgi:hypothetical protein